MAEVLDRIQERIEKGKKAVKNAEALLELGKRLDMNLTKQETELAEAKTQLEEFEKALQETKNRV